jgi:CBS domain-containing protein
MGTVRSILAGKADTVLTTSKEAMVFDAIGVMAENGVGALVVTEGDAVVGIVTERDYLRKVALEGRSSRETPVQAIMSSPVVVVSRALTIEQCMGLMTEHRCRHLPVVQDGELVGIISIGDCVKQIAKEQKDEIAHLTEYIGGRT